MDSSINSEIEAAEQEWKDGWKRGPQRVRWTELPLQVGDQAPDFELAASSGETMKLSNLWDNGPALILFWRHYGCSCGIDRAERLKAEYSDYIGSGAKMAIIGQGEPRRAAAYARKYALPPVTILSDPEFETYMAYGLLEGKPSQILFDAPDEYLDLDLNAGMELAEARRKAGRPLVDNSWLLPGEFVVDRFGEVRLTYRYNYCEDFPDHRVLLAAIREAAMAKSG
jgi:peroxiredoxin